MSQGMTGVLCPQMAHISVNAHVSAVFVVMMGGASVWYRAALRVCACRCVLACLPDGQCTYVCVLYSWTVHAHTVFPSDGCLLPCLSISFPVVCMLFAPRSVAQARVDLATLSVMMTLAAFSPAQLASLCSAAALAALEQDSELTTEHVKASMLEHMSRMQRMASATAAPALSVGN